MYVILRGLRALYLWFELAIVTIVIYVFSWLPWTKPHPVSYLFHTWCRSFVRALGVQLYLHQKNRLPLPDRYILIANHPSAFEDVGIPALFDVVSLAKLQVTDWWVVGRISKAAGTLYVDREDKDSRQQSIDTMLAALKSGQNIALYPEGGCKGRRLYPEFKSGAFDVAIQSGLPIVPVFIAYEAQDDFEWQNQSLLRKLWDISTSVNPRANYYVFDAVAPTGFADKYEMKAAIYEKYRQWNEKYLE